MNPLFLHFQPIITLADEIISTCSYQVAHPWVGSLLGKLKNDSFNTDMSPNLHQDGG